MGNDNWEINITRPVTATRSREPDQSLLFTFLPRKITGTYVETSQVSERLMKLAPSAAKDYSLAFMHVFFFPLKTA